MENEIVFELKEAANASSRNSAMPEAELDPSDTLGGSAFTMDADVSGLDSHSKAFQRAVRCSKVLIKLTIASFRPHSWPFFRHRVRLVICRLQ